MGEMKSAWEKAMERAEKLGKPSDEELKLLELLPVGNKLAARYLQEADFDLDAELTKYRGTGLRKYITRGAQEIFLSNIVLPQSDTDKQKAIRAMAGLRLIKENKNQVEAVLDRITNLLNYYEQARQQTYSQFRKGFEARLQEASRVIQSQTTNAAVVEMQLQAQFQTEWHRISSQLNAQYEKCSRSISNV